MTARNWRSTFTAFRMLDAERLPVWKVSRPSAIGRSSSSSVRTTPSPASSAMIIRMPLAPTSMTEMIGGRASPVATGVAATGAVAVIPAGAAFAARSVNVHHRLQTELLQKQVPLVLQRPLVQRHVASRANLEPQLRVARLGLHRRDLLLVVVIQRVRHAQERGEGAHAVPVLVRQLGVASMF